jgi:fatty-acid desaturase
MSLNQKIRSLQLANLMLSFVGLYYCIASSEYVYLLASYVAFILLCPLGISTGLHRLLTHKSFTTSVLMERLLTLLSVYATVGSPIAWVAIHRAHHGYSDTSIDPHSPYLDQRLNLSKIFTVSTGIGQAVQTKIPISFVKDLCKDNFQRLVHDHYFKILLVPVLILFLINPMFGIFLYSIPATLSFYTTSIVNVLGHSHGYRSHEVRDKSTNSWIANFISLGEGWHNNHHHNPANFNLQEKWWEWDLIGLFIKLIKKSG